MNLNRVRMLVVCLALSIAPIPARLSAQGAVTVFKGTPTLKVSEGGLDRLPEPLSGAAAANLISTFPT